MISAGTPPYALKPIAEGQEGILQAELRDNIIDITGLKIGTVTLEVEDSAETPARVPSTIVVREPRFEAGLRGCSPHPVGGVQTRILVSDPPSEQSPARTRGVDWHRQSHSGTRITRTRLDSGPGKNVFRGSPQDFQVFNVSEVVSPESVRFEAARVEDGAFEIAAEGSVEGGSALLTVRHLPTPPAESLVQLSVEQEILLDHELVRLPQAAGEDFEVTASFTSVTVLDGEDVPLTKSRTQTFTTVAPLPGAPRLEQLRPVLGPIGELVTITGSGFDPEPENNVITFATIGDRLPTGLRWSGGSW